MAPRFPIFPQTEEDFGGTVDGIKIPEVSPNCGNLGVVQATQLVISGCVPGGRAVALSTGPKVKVLVITYLLHSP